MKTLPVVSAILAVAALFANGQPIEPARSTAQVTIRAELKAIRAEREKKQADDKGDKKPKAETVTKSLEVEISAAATVNGPLKMVTWWYARDLSEKKQVIAKREEAEITLDASKTAKATVPACAFVSTPAHSAKGADGKMERVDASGQTYVGWLIRAYEGDKLVAEAASAAPLLKVHD